MPQNVSQKAMGKEEPKKDERNLEDWVPVYDSIGVTHWLPSTCRICHD